MGTRPEPRLRMAVSGHGTVVVLACHGEIDHETYDLFADGALRVLAGTEPDVVVDLTEVTYCNTSGLKVLRHAADHARVHGRRLSVATGDNAGLVRVLRVTGVADGLAVVGDVTEVLDHVRDPPPVER